VPAYAFHVDVPAPPDVVKARVRAWLAQPPADGRQTLVGTVGPDTFRLQRAPQRRMTFLLRVRGRVMDTPAGSRVDMLMYLAPATAAYALLWSAAIAGPFWRALGTDVSRWVVFVAATCLALALTIGRFFYEALQMMPAVTEALLNPAIVGIPEEASPSEPLDDDGRTATKPIAALVAMLLAVAVAAPIVFQRHLRGSQAYTQAVDMARQAPAVRAALGDRITEGYWVSGLVRDGAEAGFAALSIPLSGAVGSGTLFVVANRWHGTWEIGRCVLERSTRGGERARIDISPPTVRDAFDYEAPGSVYLLPLDAGAARDVEHLPDYSAKRLGVSVRLLPTTPLGAEAVDPVFKQIQAEHLVEVIERRFPASANPAIDAVLAVTSQDLSIETSPSTFTFNYRRGRIAVMSTARLHSLPWYAGTNPEAYDVRVRKLATKNIALLHFPIGLSDDATSAVAITSANPPTREIDSMGERLAGESDLRRSTASESVCITLVESRDGAQGWHLACDEDPPDDDRVQTYQYYPTVPLLVMSHADLSAGPRRRLAFIRKYKTLDDGDFTFGIGGNDSFDPFLVGDATAFSWIEMVQANNAHVRFNRTSSGTSFAEVQLRAPRQMSTLFSSAAMTVSANRWAVTTFDKWVYDFPLSRPGLDLRLGALVSIRSPGGDAWTLHRSRAGDLTQVSGPSGPVLDFTVDSDRRLATATGMGRRLRYEYDTAGYLAHVVDEGRRDESYEYDERHRLESVSTDGQRVVLRNQWDRSAHLLSQTLADGRSLQYFAAYDSRDKMTDLVVVLPDGYRLEWNLTSAGYVQSWPYKPH
jgi:YD repeat-containing protein